MTGPARAPASTARPGSAGPGASARPGSSARRGSARPGSSARPPGWWPGTARRCCGARATTRREHALRPFAEALDGWPADRPAGERARAGAEYPELASLLPSLGRGRPAAGRSPEEERDRLFRATAGLLGELGAERPVMLVLDDLHTADAGSFQLLGHLARQAREDGRGWRFLATVRREELPGADPGRQALHGHRASVGRGVAGPRASGAGRRRPRRWRGRGGPGWRLAATEARARALHAAALRRVAHPRAPPCSPRGGAGPGGGALCSPRRGGVRPGDRGRGGVRAGGRARGGAAVSGGRAPSGVGPPGRGGSDRGPLTTAPGGQISRSMPVRWAKTTMFDS